MQSERISIAKALDNTGLKKKYIATKLGISAEYLNKFLSNPANISIEKALIISELTGYSINQLDFGIECSNFFKNKLEYNSSE